MNTKFFTLILCTLMVSAASVAKAESPDSTLRQDLDEINKRIIQNKIIWTGDYTGFLDSFNDKNRVTGTKTFTRARLRHRARFGLRATPNEYFRFTGRLAAYKNFGALDEGDPSTYPDRIYYSLRPSSDSLLRIDRMYVDIFPAWKWISGSVGLFPATEGLPSDLIRLQSRKSTYANLAFNAPFAGIVTALHPHEVFSFMPESHFWFIYSNAYDPTKQNSLGYSVEDATRFAVKDAINLFVFSYEIDPKVSFAEKFLTSFTYTLLNDFKVSEDTATVAVLRAYTGLEVTPGTNLGNSDKIIVHTQVEHIANTGLNAFLAVAMTPLANSNPAELSVIGAAASKGKLGMQGTVFKENRWGKALYLGGSYDFKNKISKYVGAPTVGAEYYLTQKNFYGIYTNGDDITNRFQNPGVSYKFFYTQPFTDALKMHLSYINTIHRYTSSTYEFTVPTGTSERRTDSISRTGRVLHTVQLSWMMTF